ncbi:YlaH-like family protein [Brevibacillus borstelensis]|uniref:YlaH-like family protein n=1 Tax=Brevibacillus borstelensis TaxID=45462 RepID=UPI0030C49D52
MEWFEFASTYAPSSTGELSAYESFRMWADHNRVWIIFVQLILVYYLGFATRVRMPILKTVLLYVSLFVGALIFGILDVQLPVKSALLVAIAILVIVKVRIKPEGSSRK